MKPDPRPASPKPGEITSLSVFGARLTWVIVGPLALVLISVSIASNGAGWLTGLDAAFVVVVVLMVFGRWVDQRSGTATTLRGEPATPGQFKRWLVALVLSAAAGWVIANLIGNHVLK